MTEPFQPDRFTFATFPGMNPPFLTEDTSCNDPETTYAWALHVRVPDDTDPGAAERFYNAVVDATQPGTFPWLRSAADDKRPAAIGGDSYQSWCEPYNHDDMEDARALHLYFSAPTLVYAVNIALAFVVRSGLTRYDVALSAAGDWAEQVTIPFTPGA